MQHNRIFAAAAILMVVWTSGCADQATAPRPLDLNIEITTGDSQTATAGSPVPNPLVVRLTDERGRPVPGRAVRFRVVSGGGSALTPVAVTDGQGIARQERWTLGTNSLSQQSLEATVIPRSGERQPFVFFSATAVAGAPDALAVNSGSGHFALPGTELDTLTLVVRDEFGNSVSDVAIGWAVSTGGGSITAVTALSDSLGIAKARWVLGAGAGEQSVLATGSGLSAIFTAVAGTPFVAASIASGGSHSCAISTSGATHCWGENNFEQLGAGFIGSSRNAVRVTGAPPLVSLSVGDAFSCGLTAAGAAYCWGANVTGQLGNGQAQRTGGPAAIVGSLSFTMLVAGHSHACGIANDGKTYCWGDNQYGQLGDGTVGSRSRPTEVLGGISFATLGAGGWHTCGVARDGTTYCWGRGSAEQLGYAPTSNCGDYFYYYDEPCSLEPARLPNAPTFKSLAAGSEHTCGLASDEAAYCWGWGIAVATNVPGGLRFTALTAGASAQSCGLTTSGEAYCWKLDNRAITAPQLASARITFAGLSLRSSHICGIARGEPSFAYCWGGNAAGQIGDGTTFFRVTPVQIVSPTA